MDRDRIDKDTRWRGASGLAAVAHGSDGECQGSVCLEYDLFVLFGWLKGFGIGTPD
jgi:hypothetical protein